MMKIGTLAALPLALLASQAVAENWVKVDPNSLLQVDKDSIHRGSDGFIYFTDIEVGQEGDWAADCQKRVIFMNDGGSLTEWAAADEVKPGSVPDMQLSYVCANVP